LLLPFGGPFGLLKPTGLTATGFAGSRGGVGGSLTVVGGWGLRSEHATLVQGGGGVCCFEVANLLRHDDCFESQLS
jgi:hypothetical protein